MLLLDLFIFAVITISFPYSYSFKKGIYKYLLLILFFISYLLTLYFTNSENIKFKDFLVYSKILFYLLFSIMLASSKLKFSIYCYLKIYKFIVLLFFSEYLITQCLGINHKFRPNLFVENNFEIIFLIILQITSELIFNFKCKKYSIMVCLTVFLSMSISGVASYLFYLFYKNLFFNKKYFLSIMTVIISFILVSILFSFRYNNLDYSDYSSIDRIMFFNIFLDELSNDYFWSLLIGKDFMTPLSYQNAVHLEFYSRLFSNIDIHLVYSVIFHALNLRLIYDFGLLGVLFVYLAIFEILKSAGADCKISVLICSILFLSGFSVSSLNSSIIMLGFIILLLSIKFQNNNVFFNKKNI